MAQTERLVEFLSTVNLSVAAFGVVYCLTQSRHRATFRVLAAVLGAAVVAELDTSVSGLIASAHARVLLSAVGIWGILCAAPLFWLYVWRITAEGNQWPRALGLHALMPGLGFLAIGALTTIPVPEQLYLFSDAGSRPTGFGLWIGGLLEILTMLLPLQWMIYVVLVAMRLTRYRSRLKDLYASTETRELGWIWAVISLFALYTTLGFGTLLLDELIAIGEIGDVPDHLLSLALVSTITLWGMRQRPGLTPDAEPSEKTARYARSALTEDRSQVIANRLRRAMVDDALYLNPNLTLWVLARHVSVSDNYVSQVLSEEIGQNFYDFVNGFRIAAAKSRMQDSDETILAIAYEVGFNSRSSFYTAFRKATGLTPTAFRANPV